MKTKFDIIKKYVISFLLPVLFCFSGMSVINVHAASDDFRVIGYYSGSSFDEPVSSTQFDKLTHIMYAFLKPTSDGTCRQVDKPDQMIEVIEAAHEKGCKVFIAVGGWSDNGVPLRETFEKISADDSLRSIFERSVMEFVNEYGFDGVELDWEHPNSSSAESYEKLVLELSDLLHQENKELSAAVNAISSTTAGPDTSTYYSDACLDSLDFISIMGYDKNNDDHSPIDFSIASIKYWEARGVIPQKIVLGMPLYARPSWIQYRHLVEANPQNAYVDHAQTTPLESYYNSIHTLREKTIYSIRNNLAGVMLFDVNEDATGEYSVVSMIDDNLNDISTMNYEEMSKYISIVVDNKAFRFSGSDGYGIPFIDSNSRTQIPVRKITEELGAEVKYNDKTKEISIAFPQAYLNNNILLTVGEKKITIDGEVHDLDTAPLIIKDRTYLPARAVFEALGYNVSFGLSGCCVYASSQS